MCDSNTANLLEFVWCYQTQVHTGHLNRPVTQGQVVGVREKVYLER